MKGDFSRSSFEPEQHFTTVRLQQGRVLTDADFNEAQDIHRHLLRVTTRDLVGPTGAPRDGGGFGLYPTPTGGDLILLPGRMYVDGIPAECPAGPWLETDPGTIGINDRVFLREWPADDRGLTVGRWIQVDSFNIPGTLHFTRITAVDAASRTVTFDPGIPAVQFNAIRWVLSFVTQKLDTIGQPAEPIDEQPSTALLARRRPSLPPPPINGLLYLDVWDHHLTALEEPSLREVALGGPDTATRTQTVWEVRTAPNVITCRDFQPTRSTGRLSARSNPAAAGTRPCDIPPTAGYRGLENQLYRVEIHDAGSTAAGSPPTFKWSRDNGAIAFRIVEQIDQTQLRLATLGRDEFTSIKANDFVELTNDVLERSGQRGRMFKVSLQPQEPERIITLDGTLAPPLDLGLGQKLRLWSGTVATTPVDPTTDVHLENGVEIRFEPGSYASGDYWMIPARSAFGSDTGDVIWPMNDAVTPPRPIPQPPHGIIHHFAALGVLTFVSGLPVIRDCRHLFPAVTELTSLFYVGGDGQEALPDLTASPRPLALLPMPLEVGVSNGAPVAGARVRFRVLQGNGRITNLPLQPPSQDELVAETGFDGRAMVTWALEASNAAPVVQSVEARLLDADGTELHIPIIFSATLSIASRVAFDPSKCADLADAKTVQEAIEHLCERTEGGVCTITMQKNTPWSFLETEVPKHTRLEICFAVGDFNAGTKAILFQNKEHVKITGGGYGTRIVGEAPPFLFQKCGTVIARDFYIQNDEADMACMEAVDCGRVVLEHVTAHCAGKSGAARACVEITSAQSLQSVEVRHCQFEIGLNQTGLLLGNLRHAIIEDNLAAPYLKLTGPFNPGTEVFNQLKQQLTPTFSTPTNTTPLLPEPGRNIDRLTNINLPNVNLPNIGVPIGIPIAGRNIQFQTDPALAPGWTAAIAAFPPTGALDTEAKVQQYFDQLVEKILVDADFRSQPALRVFDSFINIGVATFTPQADYGIHLQCSEAGEVQLIGNEVRQARKGIVLEGIQPAQSVTVTTGGGNFGRTHAIERAVVFRNSVFLLPGGAGDPTTGIRVNSCASEVIDSNYVQGSPLLNDQFSSRGIYVDLPHPTFMSIRGNHLRILRIGIEKPFRIADNAGLWIITDNLTERGANQLPPNVPPAMVVERNNAFA
jgi:hypothetical protein